MTGLAVSRNFPFTHAWDTVQTKSPIPYTDYFLVLDPTGQEIRHAGYWHPDERYFENARNYAFRRDVIASPDHGQLYTMLRVMKHHNGQLYLLASIDSLYQDSLRTFRAFQPLHSGDRSDLAIVRTRSPGCELLSCHVETADTVRIFQQPKLVSPEYLTVTVDIANIDVSITAVDVECVLTLPPGILLDPPTQSLRKSPPDARLDPGRSERFTWTVRVDTAALEDSLLWIDAVTYYRDLEYARPGPPPSVTACDEYIRIVRPAVFQPEVPCDVRVPDSLHAVSTMDGYDPDVFPVDLTVRNTTGSPIQFGAFRLYFGMGMGGVSVPSMDRSRPGVEIPPGDAHATSWAARARRQATDRTLQVYVISEDTLGNVTGYCEDEIFVPGLPSPQCNAERMSNWRYASILKRESHIPIPSKRD